MVKQHKFIILQFWGEKSKMGFTGLGWRCWQHQFFPEAPRRGFIQGINFQLLEATWVSYLCPFRHSIVLTRFPPHTSNRHSIVLTPVSLLTPLTFLLHSSHLRTLANRPTHIIQGYCSISKSIIISVKSVATWGKYTHRLEGIRTWTLGCHHPAYHK